MRLWKLNYSYTPLEEYIKDLYHELSIFVPGQIDMLDICKKLNINLDFDSSIGSVAYERKNTLNMIINTYQTSQQQWQDFGHELCHLLKHGGSQRKLNKMFILRQEFQANNFMYHFCVPTFMLLNYDINNYFNIKDGIPFITQTFNVSQEFAEQRLSHFKNQLYQAKSDEEHRQYMESLYPKAPPYSEETNALLNKLHLQLENKKKGVTA
jgi:Zn-dependent peptidase ImmA (M78 family)